MENHKDLLEDIRAGLMSISSKEPFELIFYGSRSRGEPIYNSDYNFYLLAGASDHANPNFVYSIGNILDSMNTDTPVSLIAGEKDTFQLRVNILEPTSIHLCELGLVVYGQDTFVKTRTEWNSKEQKIVGLDNLIQYTFNRYEFYKKLKTKNTKEEISRIEKILQLSLQLWIFKNIPDLSLTELWFTDIPGRLISMLSILYGSETPKEIKLLTAIYKDIHVIKQSIRTISFKVHESLNDKLKSSISQINDLDQLIHQT